MNPQLAREQNEIYWLRREREAVTRDKWPSDSAPCNEQGSSGKEHRGTTQPSSGKERPSGSGDSPGDLSVKLGEPTFPPTGAA